MLSEDSKRSVTGRKDSGSSGGRLRMGRLVGKTVTKLPWESRSPILQPVFPG